MINDPDGERAGIALIAHPQPLHGSLDNKVTASIAKALAGSGYSLCAAEFPCRPWRSRRTG